jgi:hypothetical protein
MKSTKTVIQEGVIGLAVIAWIPLSIATFFLCPWAAWEKCASGAVISLVVLLIWAAASEKK